MSKKYDKPKAGVSASSFKGKRYEEKYRIWVDTDTEKNILFVYLLREKLLLWQKGRQIFSNGEAVSEAIEGAHIYIFYEWWLNTQEDREEIKEWYFAKKEVLKNGKFTKEEPYRHYKKLVKMVTKLYGGGGVYKEYRRALIGRVHLETAEFCFQNKYGDLNGMEQKRFELQVDRAMELVCKYIIKDNDGDFHQWKEE